MKETHTHTRARTHTEEKTNLARPQMNMSPMPKRKRKFAANGTTEPHETFQKDATRHDVRRRGGSETLVSMAAAAWAGAAAAVCVLAIENKGGSIQFTLGQTL